MSVVSGMEHVDLPVEILMITEKEIEECLTYKDVLEAEDGAWKAYGNGEMDMPPPYSIPIGSAEEVSEGTCKGHPAYLKKIGPKGKLGTFGNKWGTIFKGRPMPGRPIIWGSLVILNQADSGQPFAIMDGTAITNIRTAAHGAIGAKYLAKKDSHKLAIIGCGAQGRTQLGLYNELFPLEVVKVYDIRPEAMDKYKEQMSKLFEVEIVSTASVEEAVEGADIICMVTTARKVILFESMVPAGCYVAALVSFTDTDPLLSKKADKWIVGYPPYDEISLRRLGFDDKDLSYMYANMGEIATGAKPGRENDQERIVYIHFGAGIHDVAVGIAAYNAVAGRGLGTKVRLC